MLLPELESALILWSSLNQCLQFLIATNIQTHYFRKKVFVLQVKSKLKYSIYQNYEFCFILVYFWLSYQ